MLIVVLIQIKGVAGDLAKGGEEGGLHDLNLGNIPTKVQKISSVSRYTSLAKREWGGGVLWQSKRTLPRPGVEVEVPLQAVQPIGRMVGPVDGRHWVRTHLYLHRISSVQLSAEFPVESNASP